MATNIDFIPEYSLSDSELAALAALLDECFPDTFEGRSYFKQLPHARLILRMDGAIVGQLGLDFRMVRAGATLVPVFGIIDLCVAPSLRQRGHGTTLLQEAEGIASGSRAQFMLAMADCHDIYARLGYAPVAAVATKWLAIEDRNSIVVIERDLSDCFLVKPLGAAAWPAGQIDMLGYLY